MAASGRDPIVAAGQFLSSLQTVVSRGTDPVQTAVVSACAIQAGDFEALNVIPDDIRIGGTARAYSHAVRDRLEAEIGRVANGIASANGIAADYAFHRLMPPVINDGDATGRATNAALAALGEENVITAFPPATTSRSSRRACRGPMSGSASVPLRTARCPPTRATTSTMTR
mgnify:CR=1 FL=1